jgi:hypothetical protein
MTVQDLRMLLDQLPPAALVLPDWSVVPDDDQPGVQIDGAAIATFPGHEPYLSIKVRLFYLDEEELVSEEPDLTI